MALAAGDAYMSAAFEILRDGYIQRIKDLNEYLRLCAEVETFGVAYYKVSWDVEKEDKDQLSEHPPRP